MVADIMKSLTLYEFDGKTPKILCRDPRGIWCLDMMHLTDNSFLTSDFKMNLVLLSRNDKIFNVNILINNNSKDCWRNQFE
jgi:hypothetical protein